MKGLLIQTAKETGIVDAGALFVIPAEAGIQIARKKDLR